MESTDNISDNQTRDAFASVPALCVRASTCWPVVDSMLFSPQAPERQHRSECFAGSIVCFIQKSTRFDKVEVTGSDISIFLRLLLLLSFS